MKVGVIGVVGSLWWLLDLVGIGICDGVGGGDGVRVGGGVVVLDGCCFCCSLYGYSISSCSCFKKIWLYSYCTRLGILYLSILTL